MKLWRLTRAEQVALDGKGAELFGARYTSPGLPVVHFASEPGLAVLIALRYLLYDHAAIPADLVLGWTDIEAHPRRLPQSEDPDEIRAAGDAWLTSRLSLLAVVSSAVLPEADILLMNPRHPAAARVPPLITRPFDFAACLHEPPMLGRYQEKP